MDRSQLSGFLRELHAQAMDGEKVTSIHLFGIRYANVLADLPMAELNLIAEEAGLSPQYGTEIRKMVRLSKHVVEKIK